MSNSPNIDNQKAKSSANPEDIASPLPGDSGYVEFEKSDLRPERIERLGHYLSNTTQNRAIADERNATAYGNTDHSTTEIPHQSGKKRADYVVSGPEQTAIEYQAHTVADAYTYFQNLSKELETFPSDKISEVISESDKNPSPHLRYGSGHKLLGTPRGSMASVIPGVQSKSDAQKLVSNMIDDTGNETMATSRWAGIGKKRFNTDKFIHEPNALERLDTSNLAQGTSFGNYADPTGTKLGDQTGDSLKDYWDSYFERLAKFGPALQHKAANMPLSEGGFRGRTWRAGGFVAVQGLDDQTGSYARIDMASLDAKTIWNDTEDSIDGVEINHMHPHNAKSYGQLNTHMAPFYPEGFIVADSGAISTILELTSIFIQMSIQVTLTTAVLEIANYAVSSINGGGLWENSYYPKNPLRKRPDDYKQGSSGYRHPLRMDGEHAIESGATIINKGADGFPGIAVNQLTGGVLRKGLNVLDEEVSNFTQVIARDLGLYIPRHHLSQMRNQTGYNQRDGTFRDAGKEAIKVVDIGTAYIRSCTAGFGIVAANILGEFNSKSVGFYKNLFREVVRNTKALEAEREADSLPRSVYQTLLLWLGQESKLMKFMNYLCIIGDTSVATSSTGPMPFPLNRVPLSQVENHPSLRTAATRKKHSLESRLSLGSLPSLMLKPNNAKQVREKMIQAGLGDTSYGRIHKTNELHVKSPGDKDLDGIRKEIGNKYQKQETNRFSPEQVKLMEDQLEAEHMPFYIQDLRTNEIIAFHAFLNSLSDSYTGEWSAQKGFGRLEAAQIYGGGSRSIGIGFTLVAMNQEDFDEMYIKINKLTTLVYPQWSEGTLMQQGENKFIQPFSQVPTASPLCRIRVGEIFASNYSKKAMARMMGIGNPEFKYEGVGNDEITTEEIEEEVGTGVYRITEDSRDEFETYILGGLAGNDKKYEKAEAIFKNAKTSEFKVEIITSKFAVGKKQYNVRISTPGNEYHSILFEALQTYETIVGLLNMPFAFREETKKEKRTVEKIPSSPSSIVDLFDSKKNPIFKAFESSMGRGIAVAINSIGLEWKLNSAPWNLQPGSRAPRMCEVTLGLIPIHDITPGLDHQGINRAPIYKVGSSRDLTGDVWHNDEDFAKLQSEVRRGHQKALAGGKLHKEKGHDPAKAGKKHG